MLTCSSSLSLIHWYKNGVAGEVGVCLLLLLLLVVLLGGAGPAAAVAGTDATVSPGVFSIVDMVFKIHLMCSKRPQQSVARRNPHVISRSIGQPKGWGRNKRAAKTRRTAAKALSASPREMVTLDRGAGIIINGDAIVTIWPLLVRWPVGLRDRCSVFRWNQAGLRLEPSTGGLRAVLPRSAYVGKLAAVAPQASLPGK